MKIPNHLSHKPILKLEDYSKWRLVDATHRQITKSNELEVDEEKASQMGVNVRELLSNIQTYFAGDQSADFSRQAMLIKVKGLKHIQ